MINKNTIFFTILSVFIISSCSKEHSTSTGWNYNDRKQGGFENKTLLNKFRDQETVFVEGGRLTMGRVEETWCIVEQYFKTVTVSSFYIDETEVRNIDYLEYLD